MPKKRKRTAPQNQTRPGQDPNQRLQKVMAQAGVASRRKSEEYITAGRVTVNGEIATLGTKANPHTDEIRLDGSPLNQPEKLVYLKISKPPGYLTSVSDDRGRPVVLDLLPDLEERVFPIGRLDFNTEGVLLLTNDGTLAHALAHPAKQIPRTYHIKVRGNPSINKFNQFLTGVPLEDGIAKALHVEKLRTTPAGHLWFEMILTEGRNREVRRMCEAIGHSVTRLLRVNFANINVDDLLPGQYAHLSRDQVLSLYDLVQLHPPHGL